MTNGHEGDKASLKKEKNASLMRVDESISGFLARLCVKQVEGWT